MAAPNIARSPIEPVEATEERLNKFLNEWHDDAANSRQSYFDKIAPEGIYIGTDKTERWNREAFRTWAAKSFAKPCAWKFTPLHRNLTVAADGQIAWFDEQLSSGMGVLQASGVLRIEGEVPQILHYQLSLTIPNGLVGEISKLIQDADAQSR
jgi:hypothetical protein